MSPFAAELIGTMILILLGDGVVAGVLLNKSKGQNAGWIVITVAWGLAVLIAAFSVGQYSGAHLNPALTIGLAAIGKFSWDLVPTYIAAQMIGAFLGAVLVYLAYLPHWKETSDADAKLGIFCTGPAIRSYGANVVTEIIATAMLVLGILALGANKMADGVGTISVGLLIVVLGMSLGGPTGYALNPARDLGPRIAHAILPIPGKRDSDWAYSWVPIVGPVIGAVVGAFFYTTFFGA
ncbi:MIP family channel protein [Heliobacterium undosum]|uniref:MIP family channel protein n=1 Tax=Heliomicrobium undosum TaxID=121734 RepID=A0A845L1Q0_9FIRM|nr:MIP/aquaporin family protein [Heliomicrobium undosum]MZP30447.1 MIP family channel protein [Heliomicrobium undosum]